MATGLRPATERAGDGADQQVLDVVNDEEFDEIEVQAGDCDGGRHLVHDCGTTQTIGYFMEPLIVLALFGKKPLVITLRLTIFDEKASMEGFDAHRLNQMLHVPHVPKVNGEITSADEATSDHQRLLNRLSLYDLVVLKILGDGNCQAQ